MASPSQLPLFTSLYQKNILLLLLSLIALPISTAILLLSWLVNLLVSQDVSTHDEVPIQPQAPSRRKTILVTGVSMAKGLTIARLLHRYTNSRVIGADVEPFPFTISPGAVSTAVHTYRRLTAPGPGNTQRYVDALLRIAEEEDVDLWISCSGVASAVEDGVASEVLEREAGVKSVQFDARWTRRLHEKDEFMEFLRKAGLRVPETWRVASRDEMERVLLGSQKQHDDEEKKFIIKCVGLDDKSRADMTLLPLSTAEQTRRHLKGIDISAANPWIVQEFIRGREFCTHSLVVDGVVKAFVACPSAELLMHYEALPPDSLLSQAMLRFTERVAREGGERFTGHLSFDFLVREEDLEAKDGEIRLYPIECNPRAHTAVVLFNETREMAQVYLDILKPSGTSHTAPITPSQPKKCYWVGHDLVVCLPLLFTASTSSGRALVERLKTLLEHVLFWRDGTFEVWDPLPWWWLYHVYWPAKLMESLIARRRWSRANVSTTKMFGVE